MSTKARITNGTAQPTDRDADAFYGLLPGTNGTAAACRRELVAPGCKWVCSDGSPAKGVLSIPPAVPSFRNPWGGR